jgi:hypothetical protein
MGENGPSEKVRPTCPDGGTCHHWCDARCFRVECCEPLSGVYAGNRWPNDARPVFTGPSSPEGEDT